tara:strand:+ start:1455 stop:1664 length:210 start_codon:yes stop_codon:yes gene_type:complete
MLKFFLVGWACIGLGYDQKCVRVGSEVIFDTYEECNEYYKLVATELTSHDETIKLKFSCASSGVLEDLL